MSAPTVTAVAESSPAAQAGLRVGDELVTLNGQEPRDVIDFHQLTDEPELDVVVRRPGQPVGRVVRVRKEAGEPLGLEVSSAVFDRVRTCDNHCAFCFIHQLPKGMRRSLYLRDDDYRLSFLYGNFTTLTRFTELDAERVIDQRLGPLFVSIHATDPVLRAHLLRNPRGATSLRWLRVLLDAGIEVHGQIVVCPGVNDGAALEQTMAGVLDCYPELATLGVVPLGLSRYSRDPEMRLHTTAEAAAVCDTVTQWQEIFLDVLGHRMVFTADEYLLLAGRPFPEANSYEGFPQHENGIGMVRSFERAFAGAGPATGVRPGFFAWVDGAPTEGYRAPRTAEAGAGASVASHPGAGGAGTAVLDAGADPAAGSLADRVPATVLTGAYGGRVLRPLLDAYGYRDVEVVVVENRFFGGNIGVAGLLTGADLGRVLADAPADRRYLLPDACLSGGRFLDGGTLADLPRPVEVLPSDGWSLRCALEGG